MDAAIQRTTVTPTEAGSVVQLHISDRKPDDESASFVLQLSVSLPKYAQAILVSQAQREALLVVRDVIGDHLEVLAQQNHGAGLNLRPPLADD